ncbi:ComF family protein [Candidatus Gracilibacteria bacterium]|nr:ComF family protein [Candidatus Gracilibacteria bacterium]MCF7856770.1 ComF family protein [Candidatus Gracilibacteria bacterium]MCF7897067.1 ComF family protein [Candidatus Gracilibacteria bacterium]
MISKLKNTLLEILFPIRCVGCGEEGEWFCGSCASRVELNQKQFCPICWQENLGGRVCMDCRGSSLDGLRVAGSYQKNPELAKAIQTLKYKFSDNLAKNLGEILSQSITQKNYDGARVVSFIPLHQKRLRWRGFNQAELLAQTVSQNLNLPLAESLLRQKNTSQQAKLSRQERMQNLRDAFALHPDFSAKNKIVILVDDVASTSTTLLEAAQVLKKNGAKEVWGLVLARG